MHGLKTMSATAARGRFLDLIDETAENHIPVLIMTERRNAVLIGEDDWNAMQVTLHLLSVPGMREELVEGLRAAPEEMLSKEDFLYELEQESKR